MHGRPSLSVISLDQKNAISGKSTLSGDFMPIKYNVNMG
jgi:hypothetical protein